MLLSFVYFSPINLSHVNVILVQPEEPRKTRGKFPPPKHKRAQHFTQLKLNNMTTTLQRKEAALTIFPITKPNGKLWQGEWGGGDDSFLSGRGFPGNAVVKHLFTNAEDARDTGSITASGRSPGVRKSNPLQYSCLKNSMDRGAWQTTVPEDAENQTQLSTHTQTTHHTTGYPHKTA